MLIIASFSIGDFLSCDEPVEICEIADMTDIRFFARWAKPSVDWLAGDGGLTFLHEKKQVS